MSLFGGFPKTTTAPISFGATNSQTLFGSKTETSGLFGSLTSTTTPAATTATSFGLLSTTTSSLFAPFGTFSTSTPSFGGFGMVSTNAQSSSTFSFGSVSSAPSFKFGSFDASKTPSTTTAFGFSKPLSSQTKALDLKSSVSQTLHGQTVVTMADVLKMSHVYGDERDLIIRKYNQLQALYGFGTIFYGPNTFFNVDKNNKFASFKGFTYNAIPETSNEEGLISLIFRKKVEEVYSQKQSIIDVLYRLFGSNVNISVHVNGIKPLPEDKTEVIFYITEKSGAEVTDISFLGGFRCIPADDVYAYIQKCCNQTNLSIGSSAVNWKQQLENLGVCNIYANKPWTEKELKKYLDQPPEGIHEILWNQAKLGNPNPSKLIPFPLIGFEGVRNRLYMQQYEARIQEQQLKKAKELMVLMEAENRVLKTRVETLRKNLMDISHRTLKIMIACETRRRLGLSLSTNEDRLMVHVGHILDRLASHDGLRPRLYRIQTQLNFRTSNLSNTSKKITLNESGFQEIYTILRSLQDGVHALYQIVQEDFKILKFIDFE